MHRCSDWARGLEQQYMGYFRTMLPLSGFFFPEDEPVSVSPHARTHAVTGTVDQDISRRRELSALRAQLDSAVSSERYEEAARLRDQIRNLTQ